MNQAAGRDRQLPEIRVVSPFPAHAVPRVWLWITEFMDRVCDDFSPQNMDEFVDTWEAANRAGRRRWAVYRDGELCGVITAWKMSPVASDFHVCFARRAWGVETTLVAIRLVLEQLFASGVSKICSSLFADNRSILGLLRRLGGTVEGRLKAQTVRRGKPTDMIVIGIQREDFEKSLGTAPAGLDGGEAPAQEAAADQPGNASAVAGGDSQDAVEETEGALCLT